MNKDKKINSDNLVNAIIKSLTNNKAIELLTINFLNIPNAICDFFVICNGTSNTHVESLAEYVEKDVSKNLNEKVWKKEGFRNAQWIILDYSDVVVHIFQEEYRNFFKLENLWSDAEIIHYNKNFKTKV